MQQVAVKLFALKNRVRIMDLDRGKVALFVNMTLEENHREETKQTIADLTRILKKFNPNPERGDLAVYAQFTTDVQGGETLYNKEIAAELIKRGLMTPQLHNNSIRFLEKVSTS